MKIFGITNGFVDLDPTLLPTKKDAKGNPIPHPIGKLVKTPLNSNDTLYAELRDLSITAVGPFLRTKAIELDDYYKKKDNLKEGSVSMIRDFMRGLGRVQKEHQSSILHTNLAKKILEVTEGSVFHKRLEIEQGMLMGASEGFEYIEELIFKKEPLVKVLRLLALHSLTYGGYKLKPLETLKTEIIETYGFTHILTLNNMEKLGLLKCQEKAPFQLLKKSLNLIVANVNEREPNDIAYVYSGYAPISVRLAQRATEPGGWSKIQEAMQLLPGPAPIEVEQELPNGVVSTQNVGSTGKVTLVFFLGGVTYTEISAIRYLSKQQEDREYIVATTKLLNGDCLLEPLTKSL